MLSVVDVFIWCSPSTAHCDSAEIHVIIYLCTCAYEVTRVSNSWGLKSPATVRPAMRDITAARPLMNVGLGKQVKSPENRTTEGRCCYAIS